MGQRTVWGSPGRCSPGDRLRNSLWLGRGEGRPNSRAQQEGGLLFSPEEELGGSEVPSWEWRREWLPDVRKLRRGGAGEGGAAMPDAVMEQGVVWCYRQIPAGGRVCYCKTPHRLPRALAEGQGHPGSGWMGRVWAAEEAGKGLLPLPELSGREICLMML